MDIHVKTRYFRDYRCNNLLPAYDYEQNTLKSDETVFLLVDVYKVADFGISLDGAISGQAKKWWQVINNINLVLKVVRQTSMNVIYATNSSPNIELNSTVFGKLFQRVWNSDLASAFNSIEYPSQLEPKPNDYLIKKHTYSSFYDTRLESLLKTLNVKNIIAVGFWANACLFATSLDALYRNYNVFWIDGCTLAAEDTSEDENWLKNQENITEFYTKQFERLVGQSIEKEAFIKSCLNLT